jgi:hypothetical protein
MSRGLCLVVTIVIIIIIIIIIIMFGSLSAVSSSSLNIIIITDTEVLRWDVVRGESRKPHLGQGQVLGCDFVPVGHIVITIMPMMLVTMVITITTTISIVIIITTAHVFLVQEALLPGAAHP